MDILRIAVLGIAGVLLALLLQKEKSARSTPDTKNRYS